jgi:hypothetical protein
MTRVTWYKHRVSVVGIPAVFLLAALALFAGSVVQRHWLSVHHLNGCLAANATTGGSWCVSSAAWASFSSPGMLFRLAQRRIISRAVVATVAQQDDDMRRVRGNGGSCGRLRRVRGAQNGIFCRRRPGECPAKFSGPEPSRPVPGGSEWSAERRLTLPPVSPTLL